MTSILLTRHKEAAGGSIDLLIQRGFHVIHEPLTNLHLLSQTFPDFLKAQAIIVTSAQGLRAFRAIWGAEPIPDIPLFTVGHASAATGRELFGFSSISVAKDGVISLISLIRQNLRPESGHIVYLAGKHLTEDLPLLLTREGYEVRTSTLYECRPVEAISSPVRTLLAAGKIRAVLFYSPRNAGIYVKLSAPIFAEQPHHPLYVSITPRVAEVLRSLTIAENKVLIAQEATQEAMFSLLPPPERGGFA